MYILWHLLKSKKCLSCAVVSVLGNLSCTLDASSDIEKYPIWHDSLLIYMATYKILDSSLQKDIIHYPTIHTPFISANIAEKSFPVSAWTQSQYMPHWYNILLGFLQN